MKMDRIGSFRWEDPFLLEDELTEEERMIRDTARSYAKGHLAPRVREAFRLADAKLPFRCRFIAREGTAV